MWQSSKLLVLLFYVNALIDINIYAVLRKIPSRLKKVSKRIYHPLIFHRIKNKLKKKEKQQCNASKKRENAYKIGSFFL